MAGEYQDYRRSTRQYAAISITTSGNVSDFDVKAETALFDNIRVAQMVVIRNTHPMWLRFNSINSDQVEIFANEGINMANIPVSNIYITTVGGCVIRMLTIGWN